MSGDEEEDMLETIKREWMRGTPEPNICRMTGLNRGQLLQILPSLGLQPDRENRKPMKNVSALMPDDIAKEADEQKTPRLMAAVAGQLLRSFRSLCQAVGEFRRVTPTPPKVSAPAPTREEPVPSMAKAPTTLQAIESMNLACLEDILKVTRKGAPQTRAWLTMLGQKGKIVSVEFRGRTYYMTKKRYQELRRKNRALVRSQ
jgi:hypothetical protein